MTLSSHNLLHERKWGVFMHFLTDLFPEAKSMTPERWNHIVDHVDAPALARQLHEVGAGYFMLTVGQNSGFFCSPNAVYDRYAGHRDSRCARRDLIADLADELRKFDILLFVYLPSNAPMHDPQARAGFDFHDVASCEHRQKTFQQRWEAVIREWACRWGTSIAGWWVDGCYLDGNRKLYEHDDAPNFASFAAAMRAGNPAAMVAWNPGVADPELITVSSLEDYTAGECQWPNRVRVLGAREEQAQTHVLSYIGEWWGWRRSRFSAQSLIEATRNITDLGGAVTWDVPFEEDGTIPADFMTLLAALGREVSATGGETLLPERAEPRLLSCALMPPEAEYPTPNGTGKIRLKFRNTRRDPLAGTIRAWGDVVEREHAVAYALQSGEECALTVPLRGHEGRSGTLHVAYGETERELVIPFRRKIALSDNAIRLPFETASEHVLELSRHGDTLRLRLELAAPLPPGSRLELFFGEANGVKYRTQWFAIPGMPCLQELSDYRFRDLPGTTLEWTALGCLATFEVPESAFLMEAALDWRAPHETRFLTLFGSPDVCGNSSYYALINA